MSVCYREFSLCLLLSRFSNISVIFHQGRYNQERYIQERYSQGRYSQERYIQGRYSQERYIQERYIINKLSIRASNLNLCMASDMLFQIVISYLLSTLPAI